MRRIVTAVTTAVVLAAMAPGSVGASSPARASGSGHIADGARRTFALTAVQRADGTASGQAQLYARAFPAKVHMQVTCLRVQGTIAYVSGFNTKADPEVFEGIWAVFAVQDNGEGSGAPADRITQLHPAAVQGPNACLTESPSYWMDVQDGNIQVG
jgi:hypothetical protein